MDHQDDIISRLMVQRDNLVALIFYTHIKCTTFRICKGSDRIEPSVRSQMISRTFPPKDILLYTAVAEYTELNEQKI